MDIKVNPGKIQYHQVQLMAPARDIQRFDFKAIDKQSFESFGIPRGDGFEDSLGNLVELATLDLSATKFYITGTDLPPLLNDKLKRNLESLISDVRKSNANKATPTTLKFVIRRSGDMTAYFAAALQRRIHHEQKKDPATAWIADSSYVESFTMGNIKSKFKRPNIPAQQREYVFPDKKAYLIPHVYGLVYEEEFHEILLQELYQERFETKFVECPSAVNPKDTINPDQSYHDTTAFAYIVFVNYIDKTVTRPDVGTSVRVQLFAEPPESEPAKTPQDTEPAPDKDEYNGKKKGSEIDYFDDIEDGNDEVMRAELGDEEDIDVYDEEDHAGDPLSWNGTVVEPTDITPDGWVTILVERRRDPAFDGPRSQRPYVDTIIPATNFRSIKSIEEFSNRVNATPAITVRLGIRYTKQGLKDQVRCNDQLWRSNLPQAARLRQWLLGHDSTNSPLQMVDLLKLKGTSSFTPPDNFNTSQMQWWNSLTETQEVSFLHGGYGAGKTTLVMSLCVNVLSNPDQRNQVLYTIENNQAVDDVALRLHAMVEKNGLKKKIIRAHALKGEKSEVYKYYDQQGRQQNRYTVSEALFNEFTTVAHLARISQHVDERRSRGDPRRILAHMSLAQAMYDLLCKSPQLQDLNAKLADYGRDGFRNTDKEHRQSIKEGLNTLLAATIQSADVIVCTVAAAAKYNLATNFAPSIVVLDEAGRVTEFKSATLFGCYTPTAFIFAGDPMQPGPYAASVGNETRDTNPYLNPFGAQLTLPLLSRLIATGHPHHLLTLQHRCRAEIHPWLSKTFYNGQVKQGKASDNDQTILTNVYSWAQQNIPTSVPTNRYMVNLDGSRHQKESGGTSLFNSTEVDHLVQDLVNFRQDPELGKLSVLVTSFYKAQVAKLKMAVRQHPELQQPGTQISVMSANEVLAKIVAGTVDGVQGHEYDVVFLSMVQTRRNATFINNGPRLLVALSRSRYMLGIYSTMALCRDEKWSHNNRYIKSLFNDLEAARHVVDRPVADARTCHRCHVVGHLSSECTQPRVDKRQCRRCAAQGHIASECTAPSICVRCKENDEPDLAVGHVAKECSYFPPPPRCKQCGEVGHKRQNCPHVTCARCHQKGHSAFICKMPEVCENCNQEGHHRRQCDTVVTRAYLAANLNPAAPMGVRVPGVTFQLPETAEVNAQVGVDAQNQWPATSNDCTQSTTNTTVDNVGGNSSWETVAGNSSWENTAHNTAGNVGGNNTSDSAQTVDTQDQLANSIVFGGTWETDQASSEPTAIGKVEIVDFDEGDPKDDGDLENSDEVHEEVVGDQLQDETDEWNY